MLCLSKHQVQFEQAFYSSRECGCWFQMLLISMQYFFVPASHVDDKLSTVGIADKTLQGHAIFDTPLIIVPGE